MPLISSIPEGEKQNSEIDSEIRILNIAFGLDPDCHFWNNGIKFEITTSDDTVPEPTTMVLLGTGIAGLYLKRRRKQAIARI